ncbi:MAG: glutamine--fructose-6-phosphate transaminase (isomerizing) [Campylobacteraceae bacterium]|jgi:glucosamine--fructose-6-phosphate aminotransferase (isomerizing)|nr:glutamine--fructose-6-phosphate transaminase (isomerizing) [Campylobacteraceae bacterium]
MCGIVGYIGNREKKEILINGLRELEYRGYDSAGIAVLKNNEIESFKATGKLTNLEEKTKEFTSIGYGIGIGHTRWATHGKPTEINAHPHAGSCSYVVHNGIIENYREIKKYLEEKGVIFLSQTDTEVIVHLFEDNLKTNCSTFAAFEKTVSELHGAFAVLLITAQEPDKIFFVKNSVPLIIAKNEENEIFFGSADAPLIGNATNAYYLEDGEYGFISQKELKLYNNRKEKLPKFKSLAQDKSYAQKDGFRFFMEKEIYEQSSVMTEALMGRVKENQILLDEIPDGFLNDINDIKICACGTSYHASLTAGYILERVAKIKTSVEIASEFRYKNPLLTKETLFVVVSQSGETADTLEALKIAKNAGLKTLSICNVDNSSIVRLANANILTRTGIEKGVASTKTFATQVAILWLFALFIAQHKKTIDQKTLQKEIDVVLSIPNVLKIENQTHEKIKRLSKRYLHGHGFFFIGRDIFYPLALEGALKLKEISYLHAEGYPAGEMKHGPIALVDSELFTIALLSKTTLFEKTKSNIEELSARDATILIISPEDFDIADDFVKTKYSDHQMREFFEMMVVTQLFALEVAIRLGNDVDMPRNLAKSVTVE